MNYTKVPARIITLFQETPKFTIDTTPANFNGRSGIENYVPDVDYGALLSHYGLPKTTSFRERVANLTNPHVLEDYTGQALNINWVTSLDILAARAGTIPQDSFFQLASIGAVITKDDQLLLGIRGGDITPERVDKFASGLYGFAPGGSIQFKDAYITDPIEDTNMAEFREELGDYNITAHTPLGVFEAFKPGPTGIKFLSLMHTDATLAQLQDTNHRSNVRRSELLKLGATKQQAAQELESEHLPPDAWEHTSLIGVQNHPRAIEDMLHTQPHCGIGAGALLLYATHLKNQH